MRRERELAGPAPLVHAALTAPLSSRRGLELNNRLLSGFPTAHDKVKGGLRLTLGKTLDANDWLERRVAQLRADLGVPSPGPPAPPAST